MALKKWQTAGLWVLQLLLTFIFANVGRIKLFGGEGWAAAFRAWGYPEHFYELVGGIEGIGGLALLHPRTAGYGAGAVMVIMAGATVHHLRRGEWDRALMTAVLFLLLAVIAYARRPKFLRKGTASS